MKFIPGLMQVIGAGLDAASTRLAKLSHTTWKMETVSVRQFEPQEFIASFCADHSEGFGVLFTAGGAAFVVFLSASSATSISRAFLGPAYKATAERDAVAEISNIVVNAMIDEIGDATGDLLLLTAPRVVEGRRSDVMMRALESFRAGGRPNPIVSQVHMLAEGFSANCVLILLMPSDVRTRPSGSQP